MGVQPCGDLQQQALLILKTWAKKVKENLGFDKLLVFGSLVRRPENGFGRQEGDVDLLIVWGKNHVSPKQRLEVANKLVDKQLELENLFKRNIFNHPR